MDLSHDDRHLPVHCLHQLSHFNLRGPGQPGTTVSVIIGRSIGPFSFITLIFKMFLNLRIFSPD